MANPIVEEMQNLQETLRTEREENEKRLKAVEDGHATTQAESEKKLEALDGVIVDLQERLKGIQAEKEKATARIEMLEALNERPKMTEAEAAEEKYKTAFFDALRKRFKPSEAKTADLSRLMELKVEAKDVTIGTDAAGGFALPKQIGAEVDALLLKLSDIVSVVKDIQVGTSDYQELVSIHGGTSGWVAETGTRSATGTPNLRNQKPTWGETSS